ncbi:MAG: SDR family NAD(P)-dependent oxidoreductase [Gammaproteobacteria bacterium]
MLKTESAVYPSLADKRVLVTGGGSGIGAGIVEAFARQKSRVAFVDIADAESHALATEIAAAGHAPPVFLHADLRRPQELAAALAEAQRELGGIDVLINNAANDDRHEFAKVTTEYWDERIAVNLRHLFFAAQAAAASMKTNGGGAIINLGSISWHLGLEDLVVYQTAKAGIEGMTRALARELGRDNIRVNAIIPGNVQTPRQMKWYTPESEAEIVAAQCLDGRIQPEDVAALTLFLASDDARMCTAHAYWIDAGWR